MSVSLSSFPANLAFFHNNSTTRQNPIMFRQHNITAKSDGKNINAPFANPGKIQATDTDRVYVKPYVQAELSPSASLPDSPFCCTFAAQIKQQRYA